MAWSPLATQFCLELAFGVLFALAFVPRAPVGGLFYRLMGTTALVPVLIALVAPVATGQTGITDATTLVCAVPVLAYPVVSGPVRGLKWATALAISLLALGVAVALTLHASAPLGPGALFLAVASALATGVVAGSVSLAMVLGHWYLTVPKLAVEHLRRLNRVTIVSMVVSLLLMAGTCLVFLERLSDPERSLFGPIGLFHLGTRLTVGIFLPLLFAAMAASSLRFKNTRSATGILYASTVLVLIGTAVSLSLQDSYGIPL